MSMLNDVVLLTYLGYKMMKLWKWKNSDN